MFGNINPEIPRKHSKYFKETFYTGYILLSEVLRKIMKIVLDAIS